MNIFGHRWDTARKHFYNDIHEDPMTIANRSRFILHYLFRYEPRAYRWIRIPKVDAEITRRNKNAPEEAGYEYTSCNGDQMVEFHVDDCKIFLIEMNETTTFGGELSSLFINAPTTLIDQWKKGSMFEEENEPSKASYEYVLLVGVQMIEVHALHFKDDNGTWNKLNQSIHDHGLFFNL